jgi:hypothetical protein
MTSITIAGHLLQPKLEAALSELLGDAWRGRELPVPGTRRRWDMAYELRGQTTVVEFDGDEHYRGSLKIRADRDKDRIALDLGYRIVRIPYWVQLTTETLEFYFGLQAQVVQDFPHGFITTKVFPASFCELGVARFRSELFSLPASVRDAVIASLRDRINDYGREYVIPHSLTEVP